MTLDYFYGQAGELFSFFRIPKALFQEQRFQDLSTDAKTLYGILLDRMSLSVKNGWLDEQNRVFIIDYAIRKDTSEVPPRYLVFFKATDAEAFHSAFKEYSASLLNKDKRPSVLAKLHELVQAAAELPGKVRHKEQERGL